MVMGALVWVNQVVIRWAVVGWVGHSQGWIFALGGMVWAWWWGVVCPDMLPVDDNDDDDIVIVVFRFAIPHGVGYVLLARAHCPIAKWVGVCGH